MSKINILAILARTEPEWLLQLSVLVSQRRLANNRIIKFVNNIL